ncbi:hypothetical protein HYG81_02865 [Natrinema zhouii]|uniref:DUF7344 domain-containing protein n=1 Tax=Natrinema zhouii TaxID=1710539 RepID=A0A7D6CS75_9EURY|nr:hypothetical protein [Natrinema zhouii]QLK26573.1 hypothetical protein HYG81_02865 [Natrinema zhouii]
MSHSQSKSLEAETIWTLCSNPTRQSVLDVLRTVERATPEELAHRLVRSDRDLESDDSGPTAKRTITIALIHSHLPQLDAHDVVDYQGPETAVTPGEHFDDLVSVLDRLEDRP